MYPRGFPITDDSAGLSKEAQDLALRRYFALRPHLEDGWSLRSVARAANIHYWLATRLVANYRRLGLAGLADDGLVVPSRFSSPTLTFDEALDELTILSILSTDRDLNWDALRWQSKRIAMALLRLEQQAKITAELWTERSGRTRSHYRIEIGGREHLERWCPTPTSSRPTDHGDLRFAEQASEGDSIARRDVSRKQPRPDDPYYKAAGAGI